MNDVSWVTSGELADALVSAGLPSGQVVMVHARLSAFPWIVGGVEGAMYALLAAVGPDGTIAAYAGWEDNPYHLADWPADRQAAYRKGMPPFDPAVSEAKRNHGRLAERIRTWPGACRSVHPEANLVAVGPRAAWLTDSDLDDDPYGEDSPLARLVETEATILLLGARLSALTLVHHAERTAAVEPKRWVSYEMPIRHHSSIVWRRFQTIDTSEGAYDYRPVTGDTDYIEAIARSALGAGIGHHTQIFSAVCYLFPARQLVEHAQTWIEQNLGL